MSTVLVTGGAGYIGSHVCKALAETGFEPVTFDNLSTGWQSAVQFGPLVRGDLLDPDALQQVFTRYKPVAVLHFAALSEVGISARQPVKYWKNNLTGSLNLVSAALASGVKNIVFSSTCAVYGPLTSDGFTEDHPRMPVNVYGQTKLAVEHLLSGLEASDDLRSVIFRYFNAAGADRGARIGEDHRPESHLIPRVLDAADGALEAISIFGDDYDTPDGTCVRDYIHVTDLADAHVRGLQWLLDGGASMAFNLGSGQGHSVRQVIDVASKVTGVSLEPKIGPRRPGDPAKLVSGSELAGKTLGWTLCHSGLEDMISDAWRWHQTGKYEETR